jgi:amino acid adenylation domain-containing protein
MTSVALSDQRRALLQKLLREEGFRASDADQIPPRDQRDPAPLSFAQQRLWFLQQLEPESYVYNIPVALRIEGPLDVAALEESINQVICRHESLRTNFKTVNGQTFQFVNPPFRVQLSPETIQLSTPTSREREIANRANQELQRAFDLTAGPLIRARLLRFADTDHVLLLTMHHIVADGWSIGVFLRDLGACYGSSQGRQPDLPELRIQYADFSAWQRHEKHNAQLATQLAYWKHQLAGVPPRLELPTDRPRPERSTFRGANIPFLISRQLQEQLAQLGQSEDATLFMVLLAAFNVLLYRYSGQEDIAVGTPVAQRNRPELEELIGFFVNTLVLSTQLSGELAFRELLRRTREVSLGAFAHQDLPFEKLVEELHPQRNLGHSPLFQVMLDLQNAAMEPTQIEGLRLSLVPVETETAKFDLTLTFSQTGEGLDAALEYSTELFDEATASRMVANFVVLLEGLSDHRDTKISLLPILAEAEKQKLLAEWNDTRLNHTEPIHVHHVFEQQAQRIPSAIAVVCANKTLSYDQLNRRANQVARCLQHSGAAVGDLIGICLERSAEMPLAILAVLKAGCAYVPLDPAYPVERLAFMMRDTQLKAVVTNSGSLPRMPQTPVQIICLDRDSDAIADESAENLQSTLLLDHPAYVIYTSGSTGVPKGVVISHRNLAHSTNARMAYYTEPVGAFLLLPSFSFDSSVAGLFWTLCQGGRLIIPEEGNHQDLAHLGELVERHSVSHLLCLPSLYRLLLEQDERRLTSLRVAIVAGEPCPFDLADLHRQRAPQASLFNEYGPTEATVWSTVYDLCSCAGGNAVPIGRPVANTTLYILDRHQQPVPIGATGELYIGGEGVSQGYLNREELTAERFIPNPFSREPGARLYRTGDLGRYLQTGDIEFLGRTDFQAKVRGYRVELLEIELALAQHPSVQQAVALVDGNHVRAFATLKPQKSASASELRSHLKNKLPDYMVPSSFVLLESFPLITTGKIDRKALAAMESPKPGHEHEFVAPRTALERVLAGIFSSVLGIDQVGLLDNFFEMGGHSLMATQVASRVRDSLGIDLPLRRIFEKPAVGALATSILGDAPDRLRIERVAELLLQFSQVSDEQAEELLAQTGVSPTRGSHHE